MKLHAIVAALTAFLTPKIAPDGAGATFGPQQTLNAREAAADLSACQYHVVRGSGAALCNIGSSSIDTALLGILQNKPKSGEAATIAFMGPTKAKAGGSISINALVTTNGSGRVVAAGSGDIVIGRAEMDASANDVITVMLQPPVRWMGAV